MEKFFFILFNLIIVQFYGQYDSGIVKYGIDFNDESFNREFANKNKPLDKVASFRRKYRIVYRKFYSQDVIFIELKFNDNLYYSKPVDVMIPESISKTYIDFIKRNNTNYGNLNNKTYIFEKKMKGNVYVINSKKDFEWEIKDEHRNIAGFKCRKAILRKRDYPNPRTQTVAWFTPQIPVSFSPVRYHSLPGAILGFKNSMHYIYARDIEFKKNVSIKKPTDGKKISFEEYMKMMTRFKPD